MIAESKRGQKNVFPFFLKNLTIPKKSKSEMGCSPLNQLSNQCERLQQQIFELSSQIAELKITPELINQQKTPSPRMFK